MTTYITILRGINVSGHNLIKMDALKKMYETLGFSHIKTYVQSGNVIFASNQSDTQKIESKITAQIRMDFGFEVPVIVLTIDQLREIIEQNPFSTNTGKEERFMHVTFLEKEPKDFVAKDLEAKLQNREAFHFSGKAIYLYCPDGYGKTKLNNGFIENKLKVTATTRNWKTTNELLRLATT